MKRILFMIAMLIQIAALPRSHAAAVTYNHPKSPDGGRGVPVETVTVNSSLLYYDWGGPDDVTKSAVTNYVVFTAENEGDELSISFSTPVSFTDAATFLYVYEGDCKYGTDKSWKGAVPAGYVKELGNGDTFTFTATSGVISVLYYSPNYSEKGDGWAARLTAVPSKDMEWKSLSGNQTSLPGYCYPGAKDVVLYEAILTTDGGGNPFTLTSLGFTLDGTTDVSDLENIRVVCETDTFGRAIATPSASEMRFTGSAPLRNGSNVYRLIADVKNSALPGHVIDATWTSAVVAGTERISTPIKPDGNRVVANMLFMQSGENTYIVTTPINFYDDGGPEGKYTEGFAGTAQFVPGEDGKKVVIDFTELDLFNNSSAISVGNNDVIKVYDGRMVTESSLLATIVQNEPVKIHSTAADGSLTVTFTSKTGYPTQGFGAVVSLFTPVAMDVDTVVAQAAQTSAISAGTAKQPFVELNLHATGTEPAAQISDFTFSLGGMVALANRAELQYLGSDRTSLSGRKVGETVPDSSSIRIFTSDVTLKERDNWFRLYLDIIPEAENEQQLSATFTGYTINGTTRPVSNPVEVLRTVFNEVIVSPGARTVTVNSPWSMRNTPSEFSYGYDALSGDQIVTFLPGKEGYVAQLELSRLNLYFSTYLSSANWPRFKIIYGTDPTATPIYTATKEDQSQQIGKVYRSSSPDGAITVVFNANGQKGSSSTSGFAGMVDIYKSRPMQIESVNGFQASTEILTPGAKAEPVIGLKISASGNLDVKHLDEVGIDLKNSVGQVDSVALYTTGSSPEFDAQTAVLLTKAPASQTLSLSPTEMAYILEKDSYFWVTFDMHPSIIPEKEIDAKFTSVKISGQSVDVVDRDPDGVRLTKNIYLFKGDDVVTVDAPILFYDDGGPTGKYTKDHKGTVTLRPAQEGKSIRFTFHSFNSPDYFYIYNGTSTNSSDQLYRFSNTNWTEEQAPVMSLSTDGALTVKFTPASYNTPSQGWEILVEAVVPQPLFVDTVVVTPVAEPTLRGATDDNPMLQVAVKVGGEKGSLSFQGMKFSCNGTTANSLRAANLWYTGNTNVFVPVGQVGASAFQTETGELTFTGDNTVTLPGTYYFWLTYDVAAEAVANDVLQAAFSALMTDTEIAMASADAPVATSSVIIAGLKGTYRLGTSDDADYKNFAQATAALKVDGVGGPVVFEVEDGTYNEKVLFEKVPGLSSVNTVTFRSLSNNRDNVVITSSDVPTASSTNENYHGVVTFDGASYYTLEGVTVVSTADKLEGIVLLKRAARHVTLRNLHISAPRTTSISTGRFDLIKTMGLDAHAQNCDYLNVDGCLLEGGYIGLSLNGVTNVNYPIMMTGARVCNNVFRSQSSKQIYICGIDGNLMVTGNRFEHDGETMASGWHSIDCYRAYGDVLFESNVFDLNIGKLGTSKSSSADVIYVRDVTSNLRPSDKRIYNNDIRIAGKNAENENTLNAVYINNNSASSQQTADVAYNTLVVAGVQSASSGVFRIHDTFAGSKVRNNIMYADGQGEVITCTKNDCIEGAAFYGNCFFTEGQVWGTIGAYGNGQQSYTGFATLNERLTQTASVAEKPLFVSTTVRSLTEPGSLQSATPISEVTTDITGRTRNAVTPTIGAYEYVSQSALPEFEDGYPIVTSFARTEASVAIAATIPVKAYYMVKTTEEAAPSVEQLTSASSVDINVGAVATVTLQELSPATDYNCFVVLRSLSDSTLSEVKTVTFRTADPVVVIPDLEVEILTTTSEISEGSTLRLAAAYTGGQEPVVCRWTDGAGNELGLTAEISTVPTHSTAFFFTATDARGHSAEARITVHVLGKRAVATFDDWYIQANSHWSGSEENEPMLSGSYSFPNQNGRSMGMDYWTFFTNANSTSSSFATIADQYNSASGGGLQGSSNYGVAFIGSGMGMGPTYFYVTNATDGDTVPGIWLTNSAYTKYAILNGDGQSRVEGPFAKDDYYLVTFTGYNGTAETGTVDFPLADYRYDNVADRYVLDTWQWCDLSSLGKVTRILVEVSGTKRNQFGLTTPAYLCLENVGDGCPWEKADLQLINVTRDSDPKSLSLVSLFDFDPSVATVTYTIEAPDGLASLNPAVPGLVDIFAHTPTHGGEAFNLMAKATSQGRSQYLRIPVKVDYTTSVGMTITEGIRLYPVPAHEVLNVATELTDYTLAIYDMSGRQMMEHRDLSGFSTIDLSLVPGVYVVRITHADGVYTRRVIIR